MYKNILKNPGFLKKSNGNAKAELVCGFTLIETLVAIVVLLVAIGGPLTLATKSLFSAFVAKDQLIATYLVQDAIEYIRYQRDSNYLDGESWLDDLLTDCKNPNICEIDTFINDVNECTGGVCDPLKYDESTGFYGYSLGNATSFNREITLTEINSNEYEIDVNVSWQTGTFKASFSSIENIYNWLGS